MSKKIGMNVALGLNTGGFSKGLNKAKLDMDRFAKDIKRQNELASKFGAAGLGRGFGIAGGVLEGLSMGGVAGGLTGVVAAIGGMAMLTKAFVSFIDSANEASKAARQTMADLREGKDVSFKLTGSTELAAKAPTSAVSIDTFSEQFASTLAPRAGEGIADAIKTQLMVDMPNALKSVGGELAGIFNDLLMGRETGDVKRRLELAALSPTNFRFLAGDDFAGKQQEARVSKGGLQLEDVVRSLIPKTGIISAALSELVFKSPPPPPPQQSNEVAQMFSTVADRQRQDMNALQSINNVGMIRNLRELQQINQAMRGN